MEQAKFKRKTDGELIKCPICEELLFSFKKKGNKYHAMCVGCGQRVELDKEIVKPVKIDRR